MREAGTHAVTAMWAFGGTPDVATERVMGVPRGEARTHANMPNWAFGGAPCGGHEPCEGRAKMGVYERRSPHATAATGAFGGAPYGSTNRVRGTPKCVAGYTIRTKTVGLSARD